MRWLRLRHLRKGLLKYFLVAAFSITVTYLVCEFAARYKRRLDPPVPREFSFYANATEFKGILITTEPSKLAFFFSYFDSYPCPYYSDRADLIAPEINRLAQFMRSFGSPIIFHTKTIPHTPPRTRVPIPAVTENHLNVTSPLLQDKCLFGDFDRHPAPSNGSIHHALLYATNTDLFADSPTTAAKLALDLGAEFLVVGGMKCNQWLPAFFEQLRAVKIEPIYIYDLSDVAFFRAAQKEKVDTHNDALKLFWAWIAAAGFKIVNHFVFLDRLPMVRPVGAGGRFDGNKDAYYFKEFFDSRLL
jgi:hypothetical protein